MTNAYAKRAHYFYAYTARTHLARVRVFLFHSWPLFFVVCLSLAKQKTTLFQLKQMSVFLSECARALSFG